MIRNMLKNLLTEMSRTLARRIRKGEINIKTLGQLVMLELKILVGNQRKFLLSLLFWKIFLVMI